MKINTNLASLTARNGIYSNYNKYFSSLEKLSSGLRINKASDDAGGLSISENLRSQMNGLDVANRNTQDGISALQVAEGSLNEVSSILQRLRELSVESSTSTLTSTDRAYLNGEYSDLKDEINRVSASSEFNSKPLLDGTWSLESIQVGANNSSDNRVDSTILNMNSTSMGIDSTNIIDVSNSLTSIDGIDDAIDSVNSERSSIGANVNRLEYSLNNIKSSTLNITAAESLIRDVDVAKEMYEFTKSQLNIKIGTISLASSYKLTDSIKTLFGIDSD